ncbi:MAG: hypothetical protein U9Q30_02685 [Campylobacterota bacterium]|nr:hypothetical protein [Campylobacterota bacterium]
MEKEKFYYRKGFIGLRRKVNVAESIQKVIEEKMHKQLDLLKEEIEDSYFTDNAEKLTVAWIPTEEDVRKMIQTYIKVGKQNSFQCNTGACYVMDKSFVVVIMNLEFKPELPKWSFFKNYLYLDITSTAYKMEEHALSEINKITTSTLESKKQFLEKGWGKKMKEEILIKKGITIKLTNDIHGTTEYQLISSPQYEKNLRQINKFLSKSNIENTHKRATKEAVIVEKTSTVSVN